MAYLDRAARPRVAFLRGLMAAIVVLTIASPVPAFAADRPVTSAAFPTGPDAPRVWSFQPGAVAAIGTIMLIDFTEPMRQDSVRVDIVPATPAWSYWSGTQLVVQPQRNWRPATSYRIVVAGASDRGLALVGALEFSFLTGDGPAFADGCAMRSLVYHINGRPKPGELTENFVDWTSFKRQISRLQAQRYQFGAPDQVCAPGNEKMVSLQFDDGWATQFPAAQILAARGITAFFAITVSNLDRPGYMTRAQVRLLPQLGMTVGSHLMAHDCITDTASRMSGPARQAYLTYQLRTSQVQLEQLTGRPVHFLVYPYGCFDVTIAREAQKYYWGAWTGLQALTMPADLRRYAQKRFTVTDRSLAR